MVVFYDSIPESLLPWIQEQKLFFVATAPLSPTGHVNVSPKGYAGTFAYENPNQVWYQDLSGSGVETTAHLNENGRMTIMFVAFQGKPQIIRLWGTGTSYDRDTPEYNSRLGPPGDPRRLAGSRGVIVLHIHKVASSCGYSIPFFAYERDRPLLLDRAARREVVDSEASSSEITKLGQRAYIAEKNHSSIDGLPGLKSVQQYEWALTAEKTGTRGQKWPSASSYLKGSASTLSSWQLLVLGWTMGAMSVLFMQKTSLLGLVDSLTSYIPRSLI